MIKAVDLGFGQVKAITDTQQVEYPAAIGTYRPVRFTSGLEAQDPVEKLCIEFEGKKYFVGSMAIAQSTPRVTMSSERFTSQEGLALMMSALLLLAGGQVEEVKLIAGLPVNEYAGLKKKYEDTLKGEHYVQRIDPTGDWGDFYRFNIEAVKILPQPIGTIFDKVLNDAGDLSNKQLASGRLAVLDIGKHTVDLALTDALQFIDRSSVSYSDIGLFDAFKDISLSLKGNGYDLPADSLWPISTPPA